MEQDDIGTNNEHAMLDDGVAKLARLIAWLYQRDGLLPYHAEELHVPPSTASYPVLEGLACEGRHFGVRGRIWSAPRAEDV